MGNSVKTTQVLTKLCPGYENSYSRYYIYPAYLAYSSVYLFVRFLSVALVAARIHSASMVPGPILFAVPATSYCKEVERFQNQVNDGVVVAFSGLHFFYITRDLVLTGSVCRHRKNIRHGEKTAINLDWASFKPIDHKTV
ncbi:hypothetical protein HF086_015169 [Spodoptera exigua]|uniref:Uncharacterized protein n=1 Tax=Spodoptera exigua TaxID=7107 RepID=A0A922SDS8_SPOEX|nr:hypothetical protein HF086_015169 [Spodoptera exigua]